MALNQWGPLNSWGATDGSSVSFSVPLFGVSVNQESTVPLYDSAISFGVPMFSVAAQQESEASSDGSIISISVPLFGVSVEQVSTAPTYSAAVAFGVPFFSVSILSGEFEYFASPNARVDIPSLSRRIDI